MIDAIISGILNFFSSILGALVAPLDSAISTYLPDVANLLETFASFISYILGFIPWVLSYFHIPAYILGVVVGWAIAKIWINLGAHTFKVMLAWWRTLKL